MKKIIPDMYLRSIYDIDYSKLKKKKIKCLLFDLDNTCLPYPEKTPNQKLKNLFQKLQKMNFKIIIFSNTTPNRLENFKELNIEVSGLSRKPSKKNFLKIINIYKYKKEEVCIIGDQLFTDIYGGNRTGIYTILVDPLGSKDFILTKITRFLENIAFKKMQKRNILKKGVYYDER